jgi:hypothetical protein
MTATKVTRLPVPKQNFIFSTRVTPQAIPFEYVAAASRRRRQGEHMKNICSRTVPILMIGAAALLQADQRDNDKTFVVTASNTPKNQLLVYSSGGQLLQTLQTNGAGGASGNAGGIAKRGDMLAVVNYGSNSVSIFRFEWYHFKLDVTIPVVENPVSVAFGKHHLYVLGAKHVESFPIYFDAIARSADGIAPLYLADGSAAQVGVLPHELIVTEKNNAIETVPLEDGAVTGSASLVAGIPANVNAPFGLITRGNDAYVTIAHADEISLVRNDTVLTITPSMTQHAPCWLALEGPFLYSSNSPSQTVSRYAVYGQKIVQDQAVAAAFNGATTDIDAKHGLLAVIDGAGSISHLSIFSVDEDGNLTLLNVETINSAANGVVLVEGERDPE